MYRLTITFAAFCILSSCASVSNDPSEGGFIGGMKGVVGGEYDKRIQDKESEVDELQQLNAQLKKRLEDTKDAVKYSNLEIRKVKEALERSHKELATSRALLESEKAELLIDEETRDMLQQEQRNLETLMLELTMMTVNLEEQELAAQQNSQDEKLKNKIKQQRKNIKKKSAEALPQQEKFNKTIEALFNPKLKGKQQI